MMLFSTDHLTLFLSGWTVLIGLVALGCAFVERRKHILKALLLASAFAFFAGASYMQYASGPTWWMIITAVSFLLVLYWCYRGFTRWYRFWGRA